MTGLQSRMQDTLEDAPGTPGIVRHFAFKEDDVLEVRARVEPGVASGWHHHGEHDVYGYVVSGSIRFESGPGGTDTIAVSQGDFFHVPAGAVHRDVNPSDSEGHEVILFLPGRGPMVVNVDGPDSA